MSGKTKNRDMESEVEAALEKVRPGLQSHGGDVDLVGVEGSVAFVQLRGACRGCPMARMTLAHGIEQVVTEEVEGIDRVEAVEMPYEEEEE